MTPKKIDIIVVSHNNKDIISDCLNSILNQSYKKYQVYLLDNDSNDGTSDFIKKNYPKIDFFDMPNKSACEKRNYGISITTSPYILVMDSDAQLTKDWLKKAVKYMDENKDVGLCTGKLLKPNGRIDSVGGIISKNGDGLDIGHEESDIGQYDFFKRYGYLKSATLIMRRSMLDKIGVFDTSYGYGVEDTDLGIRANISGWRVVYNPNLVSIHIGHATMVKKHEPYEIYTTERNKIVTFIKNYEIRTGIFHLPLIIINFFYWILFRKNSGEYLRAILWNIKHIEETLRKRKVVQSYRKIPDKDFFNIVWFPPFIKFRKSKENKYLRKIKDISNGGINNITFFTTTKCNAKCKHCFYWKELNKSKDLSLEHIEKILSRFDKLSSVLLSGGEPFIRSDFEEVIELIVRYNNPGVISIPTNCLLDDKIIDKMKNVLEKHPNTEFAVTCSLDGLQEYHDTQRGVEGTFKTTLDVVRKLKELQKKNKNFVSVAVNTVITDQNYKELPRLISLVKAMKVDDHNFDIIRGEHQKVLSLPKINLLKKINSLRYRTVKYYNMKRYRNPIKRLLGNLGERNIIITQMETLLHKRWCYKCTAGKNDLVIESDGDLRICELQPKVGSLLEKTPKELLRTEESKKVLKMRNNHDCDCTHICNIGSSMQHSFRNLFFDRFFLDFFKGFIYFK